MSEYTDYDAAAENYDKLREPVAVDDMVRLLQELTGKSLSQLHVLDVGCGTGNYSMALLEAGVGKVSLFDASEGMLAIARKKLAQFGGQDRVGIIKQELLPDIPFDDNVFDAVMINFVLHHLKSKDEDDRSAIMTLVFRETARVLKGNGILLMTTWYPEQVSGCWYSNIVPGVTQRASKHYRSRDELMELMTNCGFGNIDFTTIFGSNWTNRYLEAEGPLSEEWRNLDSYWSLFTEEELQTALTKVLEMKAAGTLNQFMLDNDKSMSQGHIVLVKAVKQ